MGKSKSGAAAASSSSSASESSKHAPRADDAAHHTPRYSHHYPLALVLRARAIEGHVADVLGVYRRDDAAGPVNSRPCYRHAAHPDKFIAWNGATAWNVQSERNLGRTRGWLQLLDRADAAPHESRVLWEAWDGKAWTTQPELVCDAAELSLLPPPAALEISGPHIDSEAAGCLGLYALVANRLVHGRAVWRHAARPNRWLAFNGENAWNAQSEANLGKSRGWLQLLDTSCTTPDLSARAWDAADGKGGWMRVPSLVVRAADPRTLPPPIAIRLEMLSDGAIGTAPASASAAAAAGEVRSGGDTSDAPQATSTPHAPPHAHANASNPPALSGTAANFLGLYKLALDHEVNGRPAYRHTQSAGRWIAYNGENAWNAQSEASLGQKRGWLQLLDAAASTPDASKAPWDSADGSGRWSRQLTLRCTAVDAACLPPPKAIVLDGDEVTGAAANYLGLYHLVEGRLVNERPCYRHAERPSHWMAYNGSSAWNAQSEASLGQSRGWLQLLDTSCPTPDLSRLPWEIADGTGLWETRPSLRCREAELSLLPPSPALLLEGASQPKAQECHGLYRLVRGREVNGRPCWRSTRRPDRWVAFNGENAWNAQSEASLGQKRGWLQLLDSAVSTPDFSTASWEAWDGTTWVRQADFSCRAVDVERLPPPPALELTGAIIAGSAGLCLGRYRLSDREVNGRPAYQKIDRDDRWLAFNGDNAWNAQSAASLGEKKGWIQLLDAVATPDASAAGWEAWVNSRWQPQPALSCIALYEPPLPATSVLKFAGGAVGDAAAAATGERGAPSPPDAAKLAPSRVAPDPHTGAIEPAARTTTEAKILAAAAAAAEASGASTAADGGGAASGPAHSQRLRPDADSSISAVPTLKLAAPDEPCRACLLRCAAAVPHMEQLCADVDFKVRQLQWETLPANLDTDELWALAAYTYDFNENEREGNLFYELNRGLRARDAKARGSVLTMWGGYLFYLMRALDKLPSLRMYVYRGHPDREAVLRQYKEGRPIQWGAFSSTSRRPELAALFTDRERGIIFRIKVLTGKDIRDFSFFNVEEEEVLLSPQTRFVVVSEPYLNDADGYTYLDLLEQTGTLFLS